jgi:uncharacterized protein (TIGR03435 family)
MDRTTQPAAKNVMSATAPAMFLLLAAGALSAQPRDVRPAYEAASVKPNTSASRGSSSKESKGQIVFTNLSLERLIERAYSVKQFQVSGPGWAEEVRFDIAAKYPPDTRNEDRAFMLRTLLEDRFKLAVHRETKEMPGYALVVAKGGFKLKPAEPGGSDTNSTGDGAQTTLTATKTSMAGLADLAARELGVTVADKTGLDGVYDFELRWVRDDTSATSAAAAGLPSLFSALEETLGLRLQPQKVPVEIIVVDHVERAPTEN